MENGDADSIEDGNVATLSEYIDDIEAQELEADLVLGGDEGKECTYRQGYMKRQAVFACLTCKPDGGAGFCTACSLACHDGHEVVELWTRRHFRCDCGNSKYGEGICKLQANKDIENCENSYNQNYTGVYCTCHRVYPDPDPGSEALGEMLQCCICEDWFHERHLGLPPTLQLPRDDEGEPTFEEIICQACVPRCSFLSKYPEVLIQPIADEHVECVEVKEIKAGAEERITDVHESERHVNGSCSQNIKSEIACESSNGGAVHACKADLERREPVPESSNEGNAGDGPCKPDHDMSEPASDANGDHCCALKEGASSAALEPGRPVFLSKSWRSQLCRCSSCLLMYTERRINFLLDPEDTLQEYEACAKRKREESRDSVGSDFLKNLGHVQRIELLHGLNDMTAELKSFLTPFGETGKTVTSADIQDFFESLNSKRRRRN